MNTKPVLETADVRNILDAASRYAQERSWAVTISVADDGGHLLGLLRLDGASPMTAAISPGKARTTAVGRKESGSFEKAINDGRYAYLSAPMDTLMQGGLPIVVNGHIVGAIGVSGLKPEQDEEVGRAGIAALKL